VADPLEHEQQPTVMQAAMRLSDRLLSIMPPAFLMLVALNVVFLWIVMRFLDNQLNTRTELVGHVLTSCLEQINVEQRANEKLLDEFNRLKQRE
jgi:uncharacterized protein YoxC